VQNAVAQATAIVQNLQVDGAAIEGMAPSVLTPESARAQMLFLGSRQLNAFGFFLLGAVGDAVATHAICPAVIIRGEGDSFDADGRSWSGSTTPRTPCSGLPSKKSLFGGGYHKRRVVELAGTLLFPARASGCASHGLAAYHTACDIRVNPMEDSWRFRKSVRRSRS
jgi:hypothetical protein